MDFPDNLMSVTPTTQVIDHPERFSSDCVKYCPPSSAGWGVVRVALLVPESAFLFVCPSGCARHAAIAGIQLGFSDRLFCYQLKESSIVSGEYMDSIPKVAEEILCNPKFKALTICSTCIDDLLGSDYDRLIIDIEKKTKIPIRLCRMDPICMHSPNSPPLKVQETLYKYLNPSSDHDGSINVIGSFSQIDNHSEIFEVLSHSKEREIRHITDYSSFQEYQKMATSSYNLLIKPGGVVAVHDMAKRLDIPWISAYHSYGIERIDKIYHTLEETLHQPLETDEYRQEAVDTIEWFKNIFDNSVSIAVGSTANASPFELGRSLVEAGITVPYIFAEGVQAWEREHLAWLQKNSPSLKVFSSTSPEMAGALDLKLSADFAIGFDAGYYCQKAKTLPWGSNTQPYGYRGLVSLLSNLEAIKDETQDLRAMMYASGLVI